MDFRTATGQDQSFEDQDGQDYIRDRSGFAISCAGHYTAAELRAKLAQLEEADRHYSATAKAAPTVDHDAQEAAERAERRAMALTTCEAELAAAGVEFEMTTADSFGTVYRNGRVLGTVTRPSFNERRWTFHTPDGALAFTTPGRLTMVRRLVKRFEA